MEWRAVKKLPGYDVSDSGQVRNSRTGRILKHDEWNGYSRVRVLKKNYRIHRLVAEAFMEDFEESCHIDHVNRVRSDNYVRNLRITTVKENNKNQIYKKGFVRHVIELHEQGKTIEEIESSLGV